MTTVKYTILLLFLFSLTHYSCKKDSVNTCGNNWVFANEIADEANALGQAASAYGQDQSTANCQAYVDAYRDYLNAARALENCARLSGQQQEFNQAIDDAEDALDDLMC